MLGREKREDVLIVEGPIIQDIIVLEKV